jgi:hypothetical protein
MMPSHVEIVFRQLYEDLKSMKQQQWTITNYGLLILAAIYAVGQHAPEVQSILKFLVWATAVLGWFWLLWVQHNIAKARLRLDEVDKAYFRDDELRNIGLTDRHIQEIRGNPADKRYWVYWRRGLEFTIPLILVLVVGAIVVCLAL